MKKSLDACIYFDSEDWVYICSGYYSAKKITVKSPSSSNIDKPQKITLIHLFTDRLMIYGTALRQTPT